MKKKLLILAVALGAVIGVAAVMIYCVTDPAEPIYEGRPLSYWLIKGFIPGEGNYDTDHQKAQAAMAHYGTNAVPTLLRMLRANDSAFKLKVIDVAGKLRLIRQRPMPAATRNLAAGEAFRELRSSGKYFVPELARIFTEKISRESQAGVLSALYCIGPDAQAATPALIRWLTNADDGIRNRTIQTLGCIRPAPEVAVPALTNSVNDSFLCARLSALNVLAGYGAGARPALPVLTNALNDPSSHIRRAADAAIKEIDGATYARLLAEGKVPQR